MKRLFFLLLCALLALGGCQQTREAAYTRYSVRYEGLFDTLVTITGYAPDEETFARETDAAHALLTRLHQLLDAYNAYPGVTNLHTLNEQAAAAPVAVDAALFDLLCACQEAARTLSPRTNIAMGSVLRLWHDAREAALAAPDTAAPPARDALAEAAAHTALSSLVLDEERRTVYYADPALQLDLGAVGKGYAVELAAQQLLAGDMPSFLIDAGGNVRAGQAPHNERGYWRIAVQDPDSADGRVCVIALCNAAAVTSGDYQRYYTVAGVRYHHLIDPDTLMPAAYARSVTVVAPSSFTADYLSTALFVSPPEDGLSLLESLPDAQALYVLPSGETRKSAGFPLDEP